MPLVTLSDREIYYEEVGEGIPILLFAPGGMRSAIDFWQYSPWQPIETLKSKYRVIAMDQRNAGRSRAPITATDGWQSYCDDHIALLDYLDIDKVHLIGGCIGGPYCFGVMQAAPQRVLSAVIQQSIGYDGQNREAFYQMFDSWADQLKVRPEYQQIEDSVWQSFRSNMYDRDFVFSVDGEFISQSQTPLLVLMGNDVYHPEVTSREIARLSPNAQLIEAWKEGEDLTNMLSALDQFLSTHHP